MQFNDKSRAEALRVFGLLPPAARKQIQFSSVLLKNENFTGSGVLVIDTEQIQGIVTAKHNLCVRAGISTPDVWNQTQVNDLVFGFLEGLAVGYDFPNTPLDNRNEPRTAQKQFLTASNSDIEFRGGDGSWDYDLMFISFKDPALPIRGYIAGDPSHRVVYSKSDLPFYRRDMTGKVVVVTGFGDVLDGTGKPLNLSHPLQVRSDTVSAVYPRVLRAQGADFDHVLSIAASDGSSTAPGDSGGPVFRVDDQSGRVYLLGANLGSNFVPDKLLPDKPIVNNAATALFNGTSLF